MSTERRKILEMLASGKITADEAEELLAALEEREGASPKDNAAQNNPGAGPKHVHIEVEDCCGRGKQVNMKIPIHLFKAGMKFSSMMPEETREKVKEALKEKGIDIDFDQMKPEQMDELFCKMGNMHIDISKGEKKIRFSCE